MRRGSGSGGATITQVAEAAGVSRATVSRVLNGRTSVDPAIGLRVREAANRLQYRPNVTARSLSTGRTLTIALVIPDLANPMFQSILRGLSRAAEADGYSVLVAETLTPEREPTVARDARRQCDAVVLVSPRMDDVVLAELVEQLSPVVVLNRRVDAADVATVGIDYAAGISDLVTHLEGFGHRDFLYVSGPPRSAANQERLKALNAMVDENPHINLRSILGGSSMSDGYQVAEKVLASGATAVLAFNDLVAFGILARLNEFGVNVPRDLSVTGFDGIELARFAVPKLTTVGQEQLDAGAIAWSLLLRSLQTEALEKQQNVVLQPELIIGDSSGRVPPSRSPHRGPAEHPAEDPGTDLERLPLGWVQEGTEWTLLHGGRLLAAAVTGASMAPVHSPRPHLHPVRSLRGHAMTTTNPLDHRHHFGVSIAVPDVNGTTYWGGRTFLEGRGSTLLANHGVQKPLAAEVSDDGTDLRSSVRWLAHDESDLLLEQRSQNAFLLAEQHGWGLAWRSRLTADTTALTFTSPANRGRLGAGYGGLFWRLPGADEVRIVVEGGSGEAVAHGSTSPFLVVQRRHGSEWTSLLLVQDRTVQGRLDPWFVRTSDYVGIGTSFAWDTPLEVARGEILEVAVHAAVLDYAVGSKDVPALLAALPATIDPQPVSAEASRPAVGTAEEALA